MKIEIHDIENNPDSQSFLNDNKAKLTRQCQKVLDLLKTGHKLTVRTAMIDHGISSLPRRILDIKQSGIEIQHKWVTDQEGARKFKEWFIKLEEESAIHNFANDVLKIQGRLF